MATCPLRMHLGALCLLPLALLLAACGVRETAGEPTATPASAITATPTRTASPSHGAGSGPRPTTHAQLRAPAPASFALGQPFDEPSQTSTSTPTATPTRTATPGIAGYAAYRVQPGDTLAAIAERGGSDPELLLRYNRLFATPQVGRELIVPRLEGRPVGLPPKGLLVLRGNTARPWVALTLDCGSSSGHMGPILDVLERADARLTFFLTGDQVRGSPELVRRMALAGHELADHSYSHPDFTTLSDAEILGELQQNEQMIQAILGPRATLRPYFRFPYGAYDRRTRDLVIRAGYLPVHWSLDLQDAVGAPKSPAFIVERAMALSDEELRGAVILGHCTRAVRGALPALIARLRERGFEPKTLTEVLGE